MSDQAADRVASLSPFEHDHWTDSGWGKKGYTHSHFGGSKPHDHDGLSSGSAPVARCESRFHGKQCDRIEGHDGHHTNNQAFWAAIFEDDHGTDAAASGPVADERDEPVEEVIAAFESGEIGVTARPGNQTAPAGTSHFEITKDGITRQPAVDAGAARENGEVRSNHDDLPDEGLRERGNGDDSDSSAEEPRPHDADSGVGERAGRAGVRGAPERDSGLLSGSVSVVVDQPQVAAHPDVVADGPGVMTEATYEAVVPSYATTLANAFTRLHIALDALERGHTDWFEYPLVGGGKVVFRRASNTDGDEA